MKKYSPGFDMEQSLRMFSNMSNKLSQTEGTLTPKSPSPLTPVSELVNGNANAVNGPNGPTKPKADISLENLNSLKSKSEKPASNLFYEGKKESKTSSNVIITIDKADEESEIEDDVFTEVDDSKLFIPYRRSSKSTYRSRTTLRLHSQPSILEEHNLQVISMPKTPKRLPTLNTVKENDTEHAVGNIQKQDSFLSGDQLKLDEKTTNLPPTPGTKMVNFCLDYGDGILHDNLSIPKVKDCFRPWCNPFCKTCQMRTHRRPCFVLVPYEGKEPPRKRRPSMFQANKGSGREFNSSMDPAGSIEKKEEENETVGANNIKVQSDKAKPEDINHEANETEQSNDEETDEEAQIVSEAVSGNVTSESDIQQEYINEIEKLLQYKFQDKKKGYSKKRMEELSKPRGGHPAEVRFSKASLKRKQEELVEIQRTKELSDLEHKNLAFIQGKISVFLAMLNQKALTKKPKMPDIPIREVIDSDKLIHEAKKRNKRKMKQIRTRNNWRFGLGDKLRRHQSL